MIPNTMMAWVLNSPGGTSAEGSGSTQDKRGSGTY